MESRRCSCHERRSERVSWGTTGHDLKAEAHAGQQTVELVVAEGDLPERKPLMLVWRRPLSRRQMTSVEGVTLREAVEWCGDQIDVREAARPRP